MKKRLLSMALCLCMALSLLPTTALAADGNPITPDIKEGAIEINGSSYLVDGITEGYVDGGPFDDLAEDMLVDLSTVKEATRYSSIDGDTLLWKPVVNDQNTITSGTITLTGFESMNTLQLPDCPVTIAVNGATALAGVQCSKDLIVKGTADDMLMSDIINLNNSGATLTVDGCILDAETGTGTTLPKITNGGELNAVWITSVSGVPSHTVYGNIPSYGATFAIQAGSTFAFAPDSRLTLSHQTTLVFCQGTTLDQISDFTKIVNNFLIKLPVGTTSEKIKGLNLTGTGFVVVPSGYDQDGFPVLAKPFSYYTNSGELIRLVESPMDFTKSAGTGGWSETATVENDGYCWNAAKNTLTLKNFALQATAADTAALLLPEKSKLVLEGDNYVITLPPNEDGKILGMALSAEDITGAPGDLDISGTGRLTVRGAEYSIYAQNLTIRDTKISASSDAPEVSTIYADASMTITNSTVRTFGGSIGIFAKEDITVTGSNVSVTDAYEGAIFALGDLSFVNSKILALALQWGIVSERGLTVDSSTMLASAEVALYAKLDLILKNTAFTFPAGAMIGRYEDYDSAAGKPYEYTTILDDNEPAAVVTTEPITNPITNPDADTTTVTGKTTKNPDGSSRQVITTQQKQADGSTVKSETTVITDATGKATGATGTVVTDSATGAVKVPTKVLESLAKTDNATLSIQTPAAALTLDGASVKALAAKGGKTPQVSVSPVAADKLPQVARETLKDAAVYRLTVNGGCIDFGGGTVTVTLDYARKNSNTVVTVCYVADDGKMTQMPGGSLKNGKLTFPTGHFSFYAIQEEAMPFTDVDVDGYYANAVLWALDKSVTTGATTTTFVPDDVCTRAQVVTLLWRATGSPEPADTANPFTDVSEDAYYYKAVLWAAQQGITGETSATTFSPDDVCSRAQTVTFLWRAEQSPVVNFAMSFADVDAEDYYAEAVRWAVSEGVTVGTGAASFSPGTDCTRAQIVTLLYRCFGEQMERA